MVCIAESSELQLQGKMLKEAQNNITSYKQQSASKATTTHIIHSPATAVSRLIQSCMSLSDSANIVIISRCLAVNRELKKGTE